MSAISVEPPKRKWQDLEKKISRGLPIELAAEQCGIPIEEVFQYVTDRMGKVDTANWQLRLIAQKGLEASLKKLRVLSRGNAREGKDFESTDLLAAQALARISMDAMKLSLRGAAKPTGEGEDDLFDKAQKDSPWDLKKVE